MCVGRGRERGGEGEGGKGRGRRRGKGREEGERGKGGRRTGKGREEESNSLVSFSLLASHHSPPTQSALRIIDCFLLEGHKILFRVALGLLKVNEQHILSLSDPVGLFQFLKEVARHAFDVEELFNVSQVHCFNEGLVMKSLIMQYCF